MSAETSVNLNKGTNTIVLSSVQATGPNVDHLAITGPAAAPTNAVVLFDGTPSSLLANWKRDADGVMVNWTIDSGELAVNLSPSPNDISTLAGFKDFKLHVEWCSPAGGIGQMGGNSGVKLQRSYEVQVLNTPATAPLFDDSAGSIYLLKAPDVNASLGAGAWQSYEIDFSAARWSGTSKIEDARVTLRWNGVKVHDDVAVPDRTGASVVESPGLHPVLLQAHVSDASGPVRFRNIWILPKDTFAAQWQSWLSDHGMSMEPGIEDGDEDFDGLPNLWEYASGGDPKSAAGDGVDGLRRGPTMHLVEDGLESFIEFSFVRRIDSASRGLRYSLQTSATLEPGSWTTHPATQQGAATSIGDGTRERVILRMNEPVTGKERIFARLQAELVD